MARVVFVARTQVVEQLTVARPRFAQLFDARRRGLSGERSSVELLALAVTAVADAEAADQPRQGQPLADERGQDDTEGQEDDQVALREGPPLGRVSGRASAAAQPSSGINV